MPLSSITFLDWTTITGIMLKKLGNNAFERRFELDTTTRREDFALQTALIEMFGSENLYQIWLNTPQLIFQAD
mgnify:FL=1